MIHFDVNSEKKFGHATRRRAAGIATLWPTEPVSVLQTHRRAVFFFDLSIRIERRKRQERTFWKAKQFPCCIAARCTVFCPAPPRGCEMPSPQSSCDAFTHSDALKQHTNTSIKGTVFPQCVLARVKDAEKQRNDAGRRGTMQIPATGQIP